MSNPLRVHSVCSVVLLSLGALLATGCSGSFAPQLTPDAPSQTAVGSIRGETYGGRQPIVGARIFLLAAGTSGYGSASTSLLTSQTGGLYPTARDTVSTSPTYGDYYITTDANGSFDLTGAYTCTAGTQVYLYSVGGNPGSGVNSAAGLLAVLAQCPASGTLAGSVPYLYVNELSTVATAYALAGFATDALHVGSSGTALAKTGIANALTSAGNLYSYAAKSAALATTPAGNGTAPQAKVNSLANALVACINSASAASTQCSTLFTYTRSAGTTGTTPTDTATAMINLAHNPYPTAAGVSAIYNEPTAITSPYMPALSAAPADWTISIAYTGSLSTPSDVAVDASGSVWVVNKGSNTLSKFNTLGAVATGSPFSGGGLSSPVDLAIDGLGNVWVSNGNNSLSKFTSAGAAVSTTSGYTGGGLSTPGLLAIDGSNNVWVANSASVSKFTNAGVASSGSSGYLNSLIAPLGIAIDPSNNVWIANSTQNTIDELSNAGVLSGTTPMIATNYPVGIALDSAGNYWAANYGTNTVTHKPNTPTFSGGGLSTPLDVVLDGANNAWLTNAGGAGISAFTTTGTALSPTGRYQSTFLTAASTYLAVDGSGNVWVPDAGGTTLVEFVGLAVPVVTPVTVTALGTRP